MNLRIGHSTIVIFLLGPVLNSCQRPTDLEELWIGCELRKPWIDWSLTIEGNRFQLTLEDSLKWYNGSFQLNNNCALKKIDLQINDTHAPLQKGQTMLGIYHISPNLLTVVIGLPGKLGRPLSLDDYEGAVVFNFDRS